MVTQELFSDRDFKTLTYNVMAHAMDVNLINKFPSFATIKSWRNFEGPLDANNVIRYIVLCYDKGSPILTKYMQDDVKRKTLSAQYAGFPTNDEGLFDQDVDEMMKCINPAVNEMIIDFLRLFNDPNWALLMSGLESYYQKLQQIVSVDLGGNKRDMFQIEETKGKLFKQAQEMSASLEKAAQKILGDVNPYLQRDLYCVIDQEIKNRLNITPERMLGL
jgi:hypothetical protein